MQYGIYFLKVENTNENEYKPIPNSNLEYTIEQEITQNHFYLIRNFARYRKDVESNKSIKGLKIRPKGQISPEYTFIGDFVEKIVAITYNRKIPNNISNAFIIDDKYINRPNNVEFAMLKLGYPEWNRVEEPDMSKIKVELTGRDALKIKDIIIKDDEDNIVLSCKYGRSYFYNYKNGLPWYCDSKKAKLEDALSIAATVNKLKIFEPDDDPEEIEESDDDNVGKSE